MILILCIGVPMAVGYLVAEIWHRISIRRSETARRRNALIAEYFDKQLWQFISMDEWIKGQKETYDRNTAA